MSFGGKRARIPPPPPPAPTPEQIDIEAKQKEKDRRRQRIMRAGRKGTILTEELTLGKPEIGRQTLLGGGLA